MLKYLLVPLMVFNLWAYANDGQAVEEDLQVNDVCDTLYDQCIIQCDEKETENVACYSKCETIYEECLIKKEQTEQ